MARVAAKTKWFNDKKGFGFLTLPDGKDLFVHYSAIKSDGHRTLVDGDVVECDVVESPKGRQAINVTKI